MSAEEASGLSAEEVSELLDAFAVDYRDAFRLAVAVSLAAAIEPELVRAMRRELFLDVDAGAEADLWFSPLALSQTLTAMEFMPEVVGPLRQELARDQELLGRAWKVLEKFHAEAPLALRLEEELTWLGLSDESDVGDIERRLQSVVAALSGGRRVGLARWANSALPTLPRKTSDTEAAKLLSVVVGLQTGDRPSLSGFPSRGVDEDSLRRLTAKDLGRAKIGIRLLKKESEPDALLAEDGETLQFDSGGRVSIVSDRLSPSGVMSVEGPPDATPMLVEFSQPPAPASEVIEVPDTYYLLLEVSWGEGEGRRLRQLTLLPGETRRAEVGYGEVQIRTILGDTLTLRPHFEYDFLLLYEVSVEGWARLVVEQLENQTLRGKPLRVTASPLDRNYSSSRSPAREELKTRFGLSRKVGLVTSDPSILKEMEPSRPEPRGRRDWLIPIKVGSANVPRLHGTSPVLNFSDEGRFVDDFRALWKAVTGEDLPHAEPSREAAPARKGGPVGVFVSYTHEDKKLRDELMTYLSSLQSEGLITNLSENSFQDDLEVKAGERWESLIARELANAGIILMLVSPDYLASSYIVDEELPLMMRLHESARARVIPVILRPCDWEKTVFGKFQFLPRDARPVTMWRRRAEAFADIIEGLRKIAEESRRASDEDDSILTNFSVPRPPIVGFVARRDEQGGDLVERLKEELAAGRNKMVTLWGPDGIGKTTLAAEAARRLRETYEGRIVWSSALGRASFSLSTLLDDIATQLGRPDLRPLAPDLKKEGVAALVADPPALVVLDNYETVMPDEQSGIEDWFKQAQCAALITSRAKVAQTLNITIAAMSREEAQEFLEKLIAQTDDPEVFSEEVRQRVYETAEANPFLMEWVVGQVDEGREPDSVLEELKHGEGDAAESVFDRSFNRPQVGDDGRAALLALSLFTPSASREALAEVAGFGDDEKRLNEAVKKLRGLWLIKGLDENRRFAVVGLTRTLAAARLSRDTQADEFRQRFTAHFLRYTQAHEDPSPENYDALEFEKDNLLRASDAAFASGDWESVTRIANALASPLDGMLNVRGYWDEALRLSEQALQAARSSSDMVSVARLSNNVAMMYVERREVDHARRLYDESLEISRQLGNQSGIAVTLHQLGRLAQAQGKIDEARRFYEESLEISRKLGNQSGVTDNLRALGMLAQQQGDYEQARQLYHETLEIGRKLGDQRGVAATLHNLGILAQMQGEPEEARRLHGESLEIARRLGDQRSIAGDLYNLGTLARNEGNIEEARRHFGESLNIFHRLNYQEGITQTLYELGRMEKLAGNASEGERLLHESLAIAERIGSPYARLARAALESSPEESGGKP